MYLILSRNTVNNRPLRVRICGGCAWFNKGSISPCTVREHSRKKSYIMPMSKYSQHGVDYIAINNKYHVCMQCTVARLWEEAEVIWKNGRRN